MVFFTLFPLILVVNVLRHNDLTTGDAQTASLPPPSLPETGLKPRPAHGACAHLDRHN